MKIYELKLKPTSFFMTPLQGDTLFGCLCWQIQHSGEDLDQLLNNYDTSPFLVVSSGFYYTGREYLFDKPLCPDAYMFGEDASDTKQNKQKKIFRLSASQVMDIAKLDFTDNLYNFTHAAKQSHNSINRLSNTTGNASEFAPFYTPSFYYDASGSLVVFAGIDETRFSAERLNEIFVNLGKVGYGKKASVGYGHFEVESCEESPLWKNDFSACDALYALAPFVPSAEEQQNARFCYFQPFTKYGKHGNIGELGKRPFKRPVVMADAGSVIGLTTNTYYIGSAVKGVSYVDPKTVVQGYALCLPCKWGENK